MPQDRTTLAGLVESFSDTIARLSPKEREKRVSQRYALELNRFLAMAKEAAPEHDASLWPNPIEFSVDPMLSDALASYADVDTAARQIVRLLTRSDLPLGMMTSSSPFE